MDWRDTNPNTFFHALSSLNPNVDWFRVLERVKSNEELLKIVKMYDWIDTSIPSIPVDNFRWISKLINDNLRVLISRGYTPLKNISEEPILFILDKKPNTNLSSSILEVNYSSKMNDLCFYLRVNRISYSITTDLDKRPLIDLYWFTYDEIEVSKLVDGDVLRVEYEKYKLKSNDIDSINVIHILDARVTIE